MFKTLKGDPRPITIPSPKAIEKRVRRKLAHVGAVLHINRPEFQAFKVHGPCHAIIPATGEVIFSGKTLVEIAVALGAIHEAEKIGGGA